MVLAIDIGNTSVTVGGFAGDELRFAQRLTTDAEKGQTGYEAELRTLLQQNGCAAEIEGVVVSSVVPQAECCLVPALQAVTGTRPLVVTPDLDLGLEIKGYDTASLGRDRMVDAVAALHFYQPPIALFDLGTATTLSVLDEQGRFCGGAIAAGVQMGLCALHTRTAQLPEIQLSKLASVVGNNTEECLRSGAVIGAAALVDGFSKRVEQELGCPVRTVVTGGAARWVLPWCQREVAHREHLLLEGLYLIYQRCVIK